jgi:curli biogenesis system outer membrane secretion channel CsgG
MLVRPKSSNGRWLGMGAVLLLAACAVPAPPVQVTNAQQTPEAQRAAQISAAAPAQKRLKLKIAIGRFTNETRYGASLLSDQTDSNGDRLGKQASDMLAARLVEAGRFLVFERPDLGRVKAEQFILGQSNLIGVDTLILGSLTEFGRSTTGQSGFLSGTKRQTARAKVDIRLVDARTGQAFFSCSGAGEASAESGQIAGFGSQAAYDGSLNDKAIGAAVADAMNAMVTKLAERPWRTDILKVDRDTIFIAGGSRQGLQVGDELTVLRRTGAARSAQSGFTIDLPPAPVATARVVQLFGESETNEGAVATIANGSLAGTKLDELFVTENRGR